MDLEAWLTARDPDTLRRTWKALPARVHPVGDIQRKIDLYSAIALARSMGFDAAWMLDLHNQLPIYDAQRLGTSTYLDHCWDVTDELRENLRIYEHRDGLHGVQLVQISAGTVTGRPEGGGVNVVRIVDGTRAAVIAIEQNVATIGDIDLSPLELRMYSSSFTLASKTADVETARALVAQLAGELDAHFDTSTQWPAGAPYPPGDWYADSAWNRQTFVAGDRAVTVSVDDHQRVWAQVHGLPWGHRLGFQLTTSSGFLTMRLPNADLDRVLARIRVISARAASG